MIPPSGCFLVVATAFFHANRLVEGTCSVRDTEIANFKTSFNTEVNRLSTRYGTPKPTPWTDREKRELSAAQKTYDDMEGTLQTSGADCAVQLADLRSSTQPLRTSLAALQTASTSCFVTAQEENTVEMALATDPASLAAVTAGAAPTVAQKTELVEADKRYLDFMGRLELDPLCTALKRTFTARASVTNLNMMLQKVCDATYDAAKQTMFYTNLQSSLDMMDNSLPGVPSPLSAVQKNQIENGPLKMLTDMLDTLRADPACRATRDAIQSSVIYKPLRARLDSLLSRVCTVPTTDVTTFTGSFPRDVGSLESSYGGKMLLTSMEQTAVTALKQKYETLQTRLAADATCFTTLEDFVKTTRAPKIVLDALLAIPTGGICSAATATELTTFNTQFPLKVSALEVKYAMKNTPWLPVESTELASEETKYSDLLRRLSADPTNCATELATFHSINDPFKSRLDTLLARAGVSGGSGGGGVFVTSYKCYDGSKQIHSNDCSNEIADFTCDHTFPLPPSPAPSTAPPLHSRTCDDPAYAIEALKCAKNCYMCCERSQYRCSDPPAHREFCAKSGAGMCKESEFRQEMIEMCPGTCGFCDEARRSGACIDHSMCEQMGVRSCRHETAGEEVKRLCPLMCEVCSSASGGTGVAYKAHNLPTTLTARNAYQPTFVNQPPPLSAMDPFTKPPVEQDCRDLHIDCMAKTFQCEEAAHMTDLSLNCRFTCAHCLPPNYICRDQNTADCQRWITNSNYCSRYDVYPKSQRIYFCGASCGLC